MWLIVTKVVWVNQNQRAWKSDTRYVYLILISCSLTLPSWLRCSLVARSWFFFTIRFFLSVALLLILHINRASDDWLHDSSAVTQIVRKRNENKCISCICGDHVTRSGKTIRPNCICQFIFPPSGSIKRIKRHTKPSQQSNTPFSKV